MGMGPGLGYEGPGAHGPLAWKRGALRSAYGLLAWICEIVGPGPWDHGLFILVRYETELTLGAF